MNYTQSINSGYQTATRIISCKIKANDPAGDTVVKSSAFPITSLTRSVNVNAIVLGVNSSGGGGGVLQLRSKLLNTRSFIQIDPSMASSSSSSVVTQGKFFPRSCNLALASSNGSGYDEELRITYNSFQNNEDSASLPSIPFSTLIVNNQLGTVTTNDWTNILNGFNNTECVLEYDNTFTWRIFLPRGSRLEALLAGTSVNQNIRPNFTLDAQTFSFLNFSKFNIEGLGADFRVSIDPATFVNRTATNINTNIYRSVTNWRGFTILNPSIIGLFPTLINQSEADFFASAILILPSTNNLILSKIDNASAYSETLDLLIELSIEQDLETQVGSMFGNI